MGARPRLTQCARVKPRALHADEDSVMPRPVHPARLPNACHTLAWLPLAILMAALLHGAITGHGLLPRAQASTVMVTGEVAPEVHLDATGCAATSDLDIGNLIPGDPFATTSTDCVITFGIDNSTDGASLTVQEDPAAPAVPGDAMKCVDATCSGDALDDYDAGAAPAAGTSAFGMQLRSASAPAVPIWAGGAAVHEVAAADIACTTPSTADGSCAFGFGASADATSDADGTYEANVRFVALAS